MSQFWKTKLECLSSFLDATSSYLREKSDDTKPRIRKAKIKEIGLKEGLSY